MLEFANTLRPKAFILEARTGVLTEQYDHYRGWVRSLLATLGYRILHWAAFDGRQYGAVSPWEGSFLVAMRADQPRSFVPPAPTLEKPPTLFSILAESMQQRFRQSLDRPHPYVQFLDEHGESDAAAEPFVFVDDRG
jgi:site-specific DNA-cytosine methylase